MVMTDVRPIEGPAYDKAHPETRGPWLEFRRPGLTATQVRDWGTASKRRQILAEKATGEFMDLSHLPYVRHGNLREPMIAAWIAARYGIEPCDAVFAHGENPRHLASPDGISRDPFTGELFVGTVDAVLSEIKTAKYDLNPGRIDAEGVLISIEPGSKFDLSGYYVQMQWQMYVMNAFRTLFVYEQHDDKMNPATGTFTPISEPKAVWINRDEALIARLVDDVAPKALAEIDVALAPVGADVIPEGVPEEIVTLAATYEAARRVEKTATEAKADAWAALQAALKSNDDEQRPDVSYDVPGFGKITKSTSTKDVRRVDVDGARAKAPALAKRWDDLLERFTTTEPESTERVTVTPAKPKTEK